MEEWAARCSEEVVAIAEAALGSARGEDDLSALLARVDAWVARAPEFRIDVLDAEIAPNTAPRKADDLLSQAPNVAAAAGAKARK